MSPFEKFENIKNQNAGQYTSNQKKNVLPQLKLQPLIPVINNLMDELSSNEHSQKEEEKQSGD